MNNEAQMRDFIADNLYLIERGLELVKAEYRLINNDLIYGYIDILAKDRFGNLVIIELKKSKNTARQAVHEFHKYVGLIKQIYKVQESKIRCILLSTEWTELLLPYSNFVHQTPNYQLEGFQIITDSSGVPVECEKVLVIEKGTFSGELEVCPHHRIHLYENEIKRNQAEPILIKTIKELGSSFIIFSIDYKGDNPAVIHPFGHYVVPLAIESERQNLLKEKLHIKFDEEMSDSDKWYFEQEILGFVGQQIFSYTNSTEAGYAEKFDSILSKDWIIEKTHRYGQEIASEEIYSQDMLLKAVKGHEGSNARIYHAKSSPSLPKRWQEIKTELGYPLIGNEVWQEIVDLYLSEIEKADQDVDVEITIYNPTNTIHTLMKVVENDLRYFPLMEIAVEQSSSKKVRILLSQVTWNGKIINQSPEEIIDSVFGNLNGYFAYMHFGETYVYDDLVLFKHGLSYGFAEVYIENGKILEAKRISVEDNVLLRNVTPSKHIYTFEEFIENNKIYLQSLHNYISFFSHEF